MPDVYVRLSESVRRLAIYLRQPDTKPEQASAWALQINENFNLNLAMRAIEMMSIGLFDAVDKLTGEEFVDFRQTFPPNSTREEVLENTYQLLSRLANLRPTDPPAFHTLADDLVANADVLSSIASEADVIGQAGQLPAFTVGEASEVLRISPSYVSKLAKSGVLESWGDRLQKRISGASILKYLVERRKRPEPRESDTLVHRKFERQGHS
jgi:hypothetical protein